MAYKIEKFKHKGKEVFGSDISGSIKGVNESQRTITLISSSEAKDRDGDFITMKGWRLKNYIKNPVVLFCHKYDNTTIRRSNLLAFKRSERTC